LATTLVYGGRYGEAYCVANDFDQAQGRVFTAIRQICESSPLLRREADITANRITFPQTGAVIQAIGSDYASAAGAHPVVASFGSSACCMSLIKWRRWRNVSKPAACR
jgi:phage terminase large subunit-like protein